MSTFVSREVREGMEAARIAGLRRSSRLRVRADDNVFPVLRMWKSGFAVEEGKVPGLRGLVDLFDGANHLYQCLIVASEAEGGEMRYEFKRSTAASDKAPVDFFKDPQAPVALLTR